MRIVSQFSDSYDSCQHAAFGDSLVFVRKRAIYGHSKSKGYHDLLASSTKTPSWVSKLVTDLNETSLRVSASLSREHRTMESLSISPGVVFLAGVPHPFFMAVWQERDVMAHSWAVGTRSKKREFLYSFEDLLAFVKRAEKLDDRVVISFRVSIGWDWVRRKTSESERYEAAKTFFEARDLDRKVWAVEHKFPLVVVSGFTGEYLRETVTWRAGDLNGRYKTSDDLFNVQVNPRLTDFDFYKHLGPTQVYQEISMFLGNLAAPDNVPTVVSDKDRIQQHGFDERSFRKAPTKHVRSNR